LLGCVALGVVATSFLAVARPLRIDIGVEMPDRVVVGKPFETSIVLRNESGRAARALVVRQSWPTSRTLVAAHATFVHRIEPHRDLVVVTTRTPAARGVLTPSEVRIDATAPFGFFSRTVVVSDDSELLVLPELAAVESIPAGAGGVGAALRAKGTDPGAVREWRAGDQVRHVQWRSTARTGRLTVVERNEWASGSLVVLVAGRSGDPVLEDAISKAATIGSVALRRGTPVFVAGGDGNCVRARTQAALVELLARADVREPLDDGALTRAMRCAADGSVLVAAGRTVPRSWASAIDRAAALAAVRVIDVAEQSAGVIAVRARA
jgi:uncharacterized protein (DUF58 family)